jgi:hypothetical protein
MVHLDHSFHSRFRGTLRFHKTSSGVPREIMELHTRQNTERIFVLQLEILELSPCVNNSLSLYIYISFFVPIGRGSSGYELLF